jgi:hypothetical protein
VSASKIVSRVGARGVVSGLRVRVGRGPKKGCWVISLGGQGDMGMGGGPV